MVLTSICIVRSFLFFFNDPAPTEIYTLSLHDALPIWCGGARARESGRSSLDAQSGHSGRHTGLSHALDRKSTRLNSSHSQISYAVFCLKKKKKTRKQRHKRL